MIYEYNIIYQIDCIRITLFILSTSFLYCSVPPPPKPSLCGRLVAGDKEECDCQTSGVATIGNIRGPWGGEGRQSKTIDYRDHLHRAQYGMVSSYRIQLPYIHASYCNQ